MILIVKIFREKINNNFRQFEINLLTWASIGDSGNMLQNIKICSLYFSKKMRNFSIILKFMRIL
jgi:hypothetical protein